MAMLKYIYLILRQVNAITAIVSNLTEYELYREGSNFEGCVLVPLIFAMMIAIN